MLTLPTYNGFKPCFGMETFLHYPNNDMVVYTGEFTTGFDISYIDWLGSYRPVTMYNTWFETPNTLVLLPPPIFIPAPGGLFLFVLAVSLLIKRFNR